MIQFFRKLKRLWTIDSELDKVIKKLVAFSSDHDILYRMIQERTTVNADIHFKKGNTHNIIVIGRYRNRDYVNIFDIPANSFPELVEILAQIEKEAKIGRFDTPYPYPEAKIVIGRDRL